MVFLKIIEGKWRRKEIKYKNVVFANV